MAFSKAQCRLIIDSCCDLPRSIIDESGVDLVQFPFQMNDGEHLDDLWASMEPKDFYNRLRNGEVSGTAQIPIASLTELFENAAQDGTPTVFPVFSSGLSGTFETVDRLAQQMREQHPDFELYVVDTRLASIAEGLLVYEAIRQRDRGLTAQQLAEWVEEAQWYVNAQFTLDGLEHLRRGGRIPDIAAIAGSKLDIKPMLTFSPDGTLAFSGVARGRKKALKALAKYYDERHSDGGSDRTVLVASADDEGAAKWVADHLDRRDTALPVIHCSIGPVIGSHVGPGMVAVVFWGPDRRERMSVADKIASRFEK